ALDYLKDFSPAGDITPAMRQSAMGDAYAELNDLDEALSHYKRAVNQTDNSLLKAYFLKKVGMLQEKMGNPAEALEAYQTIKDEYGTTPYAADIDKYLARVSQ
ncbi:MAG: tetratricopeptide repeat protein, partial [Lewinella sp.]|nr:tetratricopeptide repeat protein [Lewinella sp.]